MNARIGHVTDARDTRPAFGILYRRYQDTRPSFLRVQADSIEAAMSALTAHVGNTQYVVTSVRPEGVSPEERITWTTETLRSGVALEVASDDHGAMGVPGTWHRVRQGDRVSRPTRNRGDALRQFQHQVRLTSGA